MTYRKADTFMFLNKASFWPARGGVETQQPHFCLKWLLSCNSSAVLYCINLGLQTLHNIDRLGFRTVKKTQVEIAYVCSTPHFQATCHLGISNAMAVLLWNKFLINIDLQNWNAWVIMTAERHKPTSRIIFKTGCKMWPDWQHTTLLNIFINLKYEKYAFKQYSKGQK